MDQPTLPVRHLVTVAHGTRHAPGNEVARELTVLAGDLLGVPATTTYVELCEPLLADVMAEVAAPSVVVPLLLSTGFHMSTDLPNAVDRAGVPVSLAPALGPDPMLARVQVVRLLLAGAQPGQDVVMVAAGSRDRAAVADLEQARDHLAAAWTGSVRLAALAGPLPRPVDVVRPGDAVSPYLLAEGFFAGRVRDECYEAAVVAPVLGPHPLIAELIAERARAAVLSAAPVA
ncbi:sirohydrochlorin chelatase [Nocardioides jishulii]|uniref:Sirohydrochlorin chelatase n=1 Tax=Nocardioides jishulii TaxID=2575440 RepID=A0A4U2YS22_9ACTN|nr:CbiX/SirB N-terminal domain-containing protein [Nocardioides jishulii]QCX28797.1 sirohydrochlorin chelatase [Nocardioides jishulii]TKI64306.1 sirohydrochlorin chelatase [Nocardioides jishulii]